MALKANFDFLFVGRDEMGFLKNYVHDFFHEHGEKSGQIFISVEIQNNPGASDEISSAISDVMEDVFFREVDRDPYERFEISLKAVNDLVHRFKAEKQSGYIGNLNILITAIVGDELFLSRMGDSHAYLVRKKYVGVITQGLGDDAESDVFSDIASGSIEKGDFILMSSVDILRYIGKADLASVVGGNSVSVILNGLGDIISTEIMNRVGLIGIEMDEVKVESNMLSESESVIMDSQNNQALTYAEDLESDDGVKSRIADALNSNFKKSKKSAVSLFDKVKSFAAKASKSRNTSSSRTVASGIDFSAFLKNKLLLFLVGFIVVLMGVIWFVNHQSSVNQELGKYADLLDQIDTRIAEAETKGAVNTVIAGEILDKAYIDAIAVMKSGVYREKANIVIEKIEKARDKFNNVTVIDEPFKLADLTVANSSMNAVGFVTVDGKSYVYDDKSVYSLVLDQVGEGITVGENEMIVGATEFEDRDSVVLLTQSGKLVEFAEGVMSFMDTDDGAFHKGVALADWGSRVYLLDVLESQIWKHNYKGSKAKFTKSESYINGEIDLAKAVDFAIDGHVYVLTSNGKVYHLLSGDVEGESVIDAPTALFNNPVKIFTKKDYSYVYVVDAGTSRVVILEKTDSDLLYYGQYELNDVTGLRDVYVDEDSKKMQVLTKNEVYEIDLDI